MPKPTITHVRHAITFKGACPVCGKAVQRSRTFDRAVEEGQDVMAAWGALVVEARLWNPNYTHRACKGTA